MLDAWNNQEDFVIEYIFNGEIFDNFVFFIKEKDWQPDHEHDVFCAEDGSVSIFKENGDYITDYNIYDGIIDFGMKIEDMPEDNKIYALFLQNKVSAYLKLKMFS